MKIITYLRREYICADFASILVFALASLAIGIISFLIGGSAELYGEIILPKFAPPALVFGIVWTVIFLMIGTAAGNVFSRKCPSVSKSRRIGTLFYFITLFFTFIWYPIFFGAQAFFCGLVIVAFIIGACLLTVREYLKVSFLSAFLMLLYLFWLVFAFFLNLCVVILN